MPLAALPRRISEPVAPDGALPYAAQRLLASVWMHEPAGAAVGVALGAPTHPGGTTPGARAAHWPSGPTCGQVGEATADRPRQLPSGARGQPPGARACERAA